MLDYIHVDKKTALQFVQIFPGKITCDCVWTSPATGLSIKHFYVNGVIIMVHDETADEYAILNLEKVCKSPE